MTIRCVTCKTSWSIKKVNHIFKDGLCECKKKAEAKEVHISQTEATIQVGEQLKLTATILPADCIPVITWTSSKLAVAEVEDGIVTAKKAGKARITAKASNGVKAICTVTVVEKPEVPKTLGLDKTELTLKVDEIGQITAIVNPPEYAKDVKWMTSRTTVATVSNGTVLAKKVGTTKITAELKGAGKVTCTVNVVP